MERRGVNRLTSRSASLYTSASLASFQCWGGVGLDAVSAQAGVQLNATTKAQRTQAAPGDLSPRVSLRLDRRTASS